MAEDKVRFGKSSALSVKALEEGNRLRRKKRHDRSQHREILLRYSKSIAFAEDSDELAKGYSNRSELLLHLKEYERCLIDIERALEVAKSAELTCRLKLRKAKYEVEVAKSSRGRENSPLDLPSFQASEEMESASEAVTVEYNEKFGRHMVATRDIRPGEVIVAERGYVCYPNLAKRHLVCSHCLSFAWNGIPCDDCAFAMYCGESCKKDASREYHDVECGLLKLCFGDGESADDLQELMYSLMVALRLLIKAIKGEELNLVIEEFEASRENCKGVDGLKVEGQFRSDKFRSCVNLLSRDVAEIPKMSIEKAVEIVIDQLLIIQGRIFNAVERKAKSPTMVALMKKLIRIYDDNAMEYQAFICEYGNQTAANLLVRASHVKSCDAHRGVVLAPFGSLINHGCCFNVNRLYLPNGRVAMFTVAPVAKGEQLCISYGVGLTLRKEERRRWLKRHFHFTCACRACEENWPTDQKQIELSLNRHKKAQKSVGIDFYKSFPKVSPDSFSVESYGSWKYDEETLKAAVKFCELNYEQFGDLRSLAAYCSNMSMLYTANAFYALYGEKIAIPDHCL